MKNNFFLNLACVATIFLFTGTTCNKDYPADPCANTGYSFAVTSEWSPQREVYRIGDTIVINASFSKSLTDLRSNMSVNYLNANSIGGSLFIYELDSVQHILLGAIPKFNFVQIIGITSAYPNNINIIKSTAYTETANSYNFKLGVVAKSKGLYAIYLGDLRSSGIVGKDCSSAFFANTLTNTNKNLNLYQSAMNTLPTLQYEIDRFYCFRVQ
jgi:hypothetical protein